MTFVGDLRGLIGRILVGNRFVGLFCVEMVTFNFKI